jgi:hypothetical protein
MTAFWDTFLEIMALVGNLGIYLLWGIGMVFVMRLMRD